MAKLKNTTAAAMALFQIYKLNDLKHQLKNDPENLKIKQNLEESVKTFIILADEGFDESILNKLFGKSVYAENISK